MADIIRMKVVGIGGAGNSIVGRMSASDVTGVDYAVVNTDRSALAASPVAEKIQIGEKLTKGQGAGSRPEVGRMAAEEDRNLIAGLFDDTDAVFLTAGMGGGTGTGAAPVVAEAAKAAGALTIGVVSTPFRWEGGRKMRTAEAGIRDLLGQVDTLFVIPNDNLKKVSEQKTSFAQAFTLSDEVLIRAVGRIAEMLRSTGYINLDFADLRRTLENSGIAHLGIGEASGKNKVEEASASAIRSLLADTSVSGAQRVIVNVVGSPDMSLDDVDAVGERIRAAADPDANIIFGLAFDENMTDALRITLIATDFGGEPAGAREPEPVAAAAPAEAPAAPAEKAREKEEEDWEVWFKQFNKD